jgi:hypothetical protein
LEAELQKERAYLAICTPRPNWDPLDEIKPEWLGQFKADPAEFASTKRDSFLIAERLLRDYGAQAPLRRQQQRTANLARLPFKRNAETGALTGLGVDESVPPYHRIWGEVPAQHFSKPYIVSFVRQCWLAKRVADDSASAKSPLSTFIHAHLKTVVGTEGEEMVRFAYNITAALHTFCYDSEVEMFLRILNGDWAEEVYLRHKKAFDDLVASLSVNAEPDEQAVQCVSRPKLMAALRSAFPAKDDAELEQLLRVPNELWPGPKLGLNTLADDAVEGSTFARDMRTALMLDRHAYLYDLELGIIKAVGTEPDATIDFQTAKDAIMSTDPAKSETELATYLARGWGRAETSEAIAADVFLRRVLRGPVGRTSLPKAPTNAV